MSWIYLRGLAEASSPENSSADGAPSAPAKITHIAKKYSWPVRLMKSWNASPYGTTQELSTDARGVESWMSSLRASRASHGALLAPKKEKRTAGTCGRPSSELSGKLG